MEAALDRPRLAQGALIRKGDGSDGADVFAKSSVSLSFKTSKKFSKREFLFLLTFGHRRRLRYPFLIVLVGSSYQQTH